MIKRLLLVSIYSVMLLSACSAYRTDVQQGNVVAQTEIDQVRKGMSPTDVQGLLGTPLLRDEFNQNRWDYVFYLKEANGSSKRQGMTVFFNNGVVSDIRVDAGLK